MSKWSHLPNEKHIDRIIAEVKANPDAWSMAWSAAGDVAWSAALDAAWSAARDVAWDVARDVAWSAAWNAARNGYLAAVCARQGVSGPERVAACDAARGAILALVAWDRAGGLMDSPAEQINILALLGDQTALLMYPAIRAIETTQELV